jgi:hypothetical protein
MAMIRVQFEGGDKMKAKLEKVAVQFPLEARRGTNVVARRKLEEARANAPRKTGRLIRESKVSVSIRKSGPRPNISASLKFTAPYASRQHETHKTKGKFLEKVIRGSVGTLARELAAEIELKKAAR